MTTEGTKKVGYGDERDGDGVGSSFLSGGKNVKRKEEERGGREGRGRVRIRSRRTRSVAAKKIRRKRERIETYSKLFTQARQHPKRQKLTSSMIQPLNG